LRHLRVSCWIVTAAILCVLAVGAGPAAAGWEGLSNLKYFDYDDPGHVCTDGIQFGLADIQRLSYSVEVDIGHMDGFTFVAESVLLQNTSLGQLGIFDPPVDAGGEPNPFGSFYTLPWDAPATVGKFVQLRFTGDRIASTIDGPIESCTLFWPFTGFFDPVENAPMFNEMKAGRAVPVKFSLGGDRGLVILASGYPQVTGTACPSSASTDAVEETLAVDASKLSYDAATDQYTFVWKTDKSWAGTCKKVVLKFTDGSAPRTLLFSFR
jgi:hypothetical protein